MGADVGMDMGVAMPQTYGGQGKGPQTAWTWPNPYYANTKGHGKDFPRPGYPFFGTCKGCDIAGHKATD